jgi:hypothetical protein
VSIQDGLTLQQAQHTVELVTDACCIAEYAAELVEIDVRMSDRMDEWFHATQRRKFSLEREHRKDRERLRVVEAYLAHLGDLI